MRAEAQFATELFRGLHGGKHLQRDQGAKQEHTAPALPLFHVHAKGQPKGRRACWASSSPAF